MNIVFFFRPLEMIPPILKVWSKGLCFDSFGVYPAGCWRPQKKTGGICKKWGLAMGHEKVIGLLSTVCCGMLWLQAALWIYNIWFVGDALSKNVRMSVSHYVPHSTQSKLNPVSSQMKFAARKTQFITVWTYVSSQIEQAPKPQRTESRWHAAIHWSKPSSSPVITWHVGENNPVSCHYNGMPRASTPASLKP